MSKKMTKLCWHNVLNSIIWTTRDNNVCVCIYIYIYRTLNCLSMEDSAILILEDKLFQRLIITRASKFSISIKTMTKKHISNGRWLSDFSADFVDKFLICVDTTFLLNFPSSLLLLFTSFYFTNSKDAFFSFFHFFQFSNSRNNFILFFSLLVCVIWCSCSIMHMLWFKFGNFHLRLFYFFRVWLMFSLGVRFDN